MNFLTTYSSAFQVIAAFVIFIVGYLALFVSTMICLLLAHFILEGARMARTHLATLPLEAVQVPSLARK
jgi:hypothetical protein